MTTNRLHASSKFPVITVPKLGGGVLLLGAPRGGYDWRMVVVYRGKHCPICTRYLRQLDELRPQLQGLGIDVVAVSADPEPKARAQVADIAPGFEVGYGLTIEQMQTLGLYISHPRSSAETDRPFAEPGLFVVNDQGEVQIVDVSNAPFARPELASMVKGLRFIRNPANNYPVRGTFSAVDHKSAS